MTIHASGVSVRRVAAPLLLIAMVLAILQGSAIATSAPASAATVGEVAAKYARDSLVGKPYVLGARSTSGFDCSGSVYLAWNRAKAGLVGKGSSSQQYAGTGTKIKVGRGTTLSSSSLKAGDLMFWSSDGTQAKIYHVAIYLGNGQILQTAKGKKSWIGSINDTKSARMAYALRPSSSTTSTGSGTTTPTTSGVKQVSTSGSGTWWGASHWNRLSQAIGQPQDGNTFGRSPAWERYGATSSRAKVFQNYLNGHDGGKTANIVADGAWGPATTEKLRAVIDHRCGLTKLGIYGAVDGKGANGTIFDFNADEAAALAKCLNSNKF